MRRIHCKIIISKFLTKVYTWLGAGMNLALKKNIWEDT